MAKPRELGVVNSQIKVKLNFNLTSQEEEILVFSQLFLHVVSDLVPLESLSPPLFALLMEHFSCNPSDLRVKFGNTAQVKRRRESFKAVEVLSWVHLTDFAVVSHPNLTQNSFVLFIGVKIVNYMNAKVAFVQNDSVGSIERRHWTIEITKQIAQEVQLND